MKCMTGTDRVFRAMMGLVILAMGLYFHSWWGAVGLMPLMVGLIGRCPDFHGSSKFYLDRERLAAKASGEETSASQAK